LGEVDYGTVQTEKLLSLNNYARTVGYSMDRLPYCFVTAPTDALEHKEDIGFSFMLPPVLDNVVNPTETAGAEIADEEGTLPEDDLQHDDTDEAELFGDDADVEVFATEEQYLEAVANSENDDQIARELDMLNIAEEAIRKDKENEVWIQQEMRRLLPDVFGRETTLETFSRLTNKAPWVPFRMPNSTSAATNVDITESALFDEMKINYNPDATTGPATYKRFMVAWNDEVTRRFEDWCRQGDAVTQIRFKSEKFLRDYHIASTELSSLRSIIPTGDDPDRNRFHDELHNTRQQLPITAAAATMRPTAYVNNGGVVPFGNPTVLNAQITMATVIGMRQQQQNSTLVAPYRIALPVIPGMAQRPQPRRIFRSKKWCIVCGWRKNQHSEDEGPGGKDKKGISKCKRNYCGNCFQLHNEHERRGVGFGPDCTNVTNQYCVSNVADWWEYKVSEL
jgi:hypothetical protein